MICIVTALKEELLPFLKIYKKDFTKEAIGEGSLYRSGNLHLLRAGLGRQRSQQTLALYLESHQPDFVLNLGLAGALSPQAQIGKIYHVEQVRSEYDDDPVELSVHRAFSSLPAAALLSVEEAVTGKERRDALYNQYKTALVDMEAYGLARTARNYRVEFYSLKIVSDFADEEAVETVRKQYKILCDTLARFVIKSWGDW
ncbi:MAG TPA: hypothetical protein ENK44_00370 [Caldithrix abyssi]|uniref:Nucleoside phosphorylase domain-containing protein n=1 Tax=Caldithrix abyssi TaxID=187145 RepID=A0A7V4TX70_CALAY|nr:hypothetical protein [Caldithrix abyssi]